MNLSYYGHCAFKWTSPAGVRVLIDPFGNSEQSDWFVREFPPIETDLLLVTHDHFDHNAEGAVPHRPNVLRGPGKFQHKDVSVEGVLDLHSGKSGRRGMQNTMFIIEVEGVRCCHIGDNRHDMPGSVREQLGRVDVLMVTVDDSHHLLSPDQVAGIIELLSPKVVIPTHYYIEGLTARSSTLETPLGWLKGQSIHKRRCQHTLDMNRSDLPNEQEIWMFEPLLP